MGLVSDYGLKFNQWYEATDNFENNVYYDYFLSENSKSIKLIAFDYEGDDASIDIYKWDEFEEDIIDNYEFKETNIDSIYYSLNKEILFNSIFK